MVYERVCKIPELSFKYEYEEFTMYMFRTFSEIIPLFKILTVLQITFTSVR